MVLSRKLKDEISTAIHLYKETECDVLLLSYLWPFYVQEDNYFPVLKRYTKYTTEETENGSIVTQKEWKIQGYPEDLWGAHMYMISRAHAKVLIDRYTSEYALAETQAGRPFCTDWQFTKFGNRGLIVPMLGLEEGEVKTDHQGQIEFHRSVFNYHYREDKFV